MSTSTPFPLAAPASTGFTNASAYDAHRASYPSPAVSKFLTHLKIAGREGARVIDLGAGTGKFTELLVAREEGFEVVAVEPHAQMRGELEKKGLKGVTVLDGDARGMQVGSGWADAVIAAQAFHWFATEEALKEIHRVLKRGGVFGVIWNIEDHNKPNEWPTGSSLGDTLRTIVTGLDDHHPRFRHMKWKELLNKGLSKTPSQPHTEPSPMFSSPIGEEQVEWTVWMTEEKLWNRYSTFSQIANLDATERDEVKKQILGAMEGKDVERNENGEVKLYGVTYFAWVSSL